MPREQKTALELKTAFKREQTAISHWWMTYATDHENGGFYGAIDNNNKAIVDANKGAIQNARILWYFSEAAKQTGCIDEYHTAQRTYRYFIDVFLDKTYGGVIWEVNAKGHIINGRKQVYAQAFAIYALTAYYALTNDEHAIRIAEGIFTLIEDNAVDAMHGGYFEAFDQQWQPIDDLRLSSRDPNWPKTMNTHLHIMEAYTTLYQLCPTKRIASALEQLVDLLLTRFVSDDNQLRCFFDIDWNDMSDTVSYGHNIECSWLLWRAVSVLNAPELQTRVKTKVIAIAQACAERGIGQHGGILDGYNFVTGKYINERIWWVQAEAMVGFLNAYELTKDKIYWDAFESVWRFTRRHQIDTKYGEWRWLSKLDTATDVEYQKSCFWKGPYHNGRAMIEIYRRLNGLRVDDV